MWLLQHDSDELESIFEESHMAGDSHLCQQDWVQESQLVWEQLLSQVV